MELLLPIKCLGHSKLGAVVVKFEYWVVEGANLGRENDLIVYISPDHSSGVGAQRGEAMERTSTVCTSLATMLTMLDCVVEMVRLFNRIIG